MYGACSSQIAMETHCKEEAYNEVLAILDTMQQEPVSDELEKVVEEIVDPTVLNAYGVKEIANRLRRTMIEPVSEELEKAAEEYIEYTPRYDIEYELEEGNDPTEIECFTIDEAIAAFIEGAKWKEKQMMKDATEVTVHIEAGNYPYIPQLELYDYDKDIPLAKEGDKYKVVLIKEAEL